MLNDGAATEEVEEAGKGEKEWRTHEEDEEGKTKVVCAEAGRGDSMADGWSVEAGWVTTTVQVVAGCVSRLPSFLELWSCISVYVVVNVNVAWQRKGFERCQWNQFFMLVGCLLA